jgi:hypothetical protein
MGEQAINYPSVLMDLKARRDRLNQAIIAIEQILGEVDSKAAVSPTLPSSNASDIYRSMTIGDAAVHFIRSQGKPQRVRDVVEGLHAGGISSKSKKLYTTAYNVLTDRAKRIPPDVVKIGNEWALPEWPQS